MTDKEKEELCALVGAYVEHRVVDVGDRVIYRGGPISFDIAPVKSAASAREMIDYIVRKFVEEYHDAIRLQFIQSWEEQLNNKKKTAELRRDGFVRRITGLDEERAMLLKAVETCKTEIHTIESILQEANPHAG